MMDMLRDYWWAILIGIVALFTLFLLMRPRQRVALTDSAPIRPHMAAVSKPAEGRGLAGEVADAVGDVSGEILQAPVHAKLASGDGSADDLARLKGVGPKFADALRAAGFTRFEQIAGLSDNEVERLDSQLGPFRGRIARDRVVEQADYMARNDIDGFEQKFGKL